MVVEVNIVVASVVFMVSDRVWLTHQLFVDV